MDNKDKKIINFKDLSKNKKEDSSNNEDKKVINLDVLYHRKKVKYIQKIIRN